MAGYVPPPAAPSGLSATAVSSSQIDLSWKTVAGALTYNVKRSTSPGTEVTITNVASNNLSNTGLNTNITYYYMVTSVGSGGESAWSAEVSATPAAPLAPFQLWQIHYFGSTTNSLADPAADASGTGQNNWFKYVAGLDPTNPSSVFLLRAASGAGGLGLNFGPIASNRIYSVEARTTLLSGGWSPLTAANPPVTNGNRLTVTDTNARLPAKFYRVGITLP